ncbi:hypothetical protein DPMN_188592 [Dreissena polymorpha]|uniref:Uncharacterized protein n=1 Tax=Dreissena polymorpha TaxID=45954 RepID=A0A9D4IA66_DREPO|nr:hypothetical protein DPMN_188592 [Dreissena polymorpha]
MGETCSKTRIMSVVVAVLVFVLAAVVAAFIYRETRNVNDKIGRIMRSELNENTVKDLYPGYFRSQEEQRLFEKKILQSFYFNRTAIPPTVKSKETCSFRCFNSSSPFPPRRKRQSNNGVKHGCCTSRAGFYVPTNHTNLIGQVRTFLQYGSKKQYFPVESCT